jgi:hypothetical protein
VARLGLGRAGTARERESVSGGKMLSSRTRGSGVRAAALLRLAAVAVGRPDTPLGAFYRRLSSRIGKAKAVTATARKVAMLFYNAVRHGMEYVDPRTSSYETRAGPIDLAANGRGRETDGFNRSCICCVRRASKRLVTRPLHDVISIGQLKDAFAWRT